MPKVKYQGQLFDMPWTDTSRSPTREEMRNYARTALITQKGYVPPPTSMVPDKQELPKIPDPSSYEPHPLDEFGAGMMDLPKSIYRQVNTAGKTGAAALRSGDPIAAFRSVSAPVREPIEGLTEMAANAISGRPTTAPMSREDAATQSLGMVGLPADETMSAIKSRNYPRLAGQATTLIGSAMLGNRMSRGGAETAPRMAPPDVLPNPDVAPRGPITDTSRMLPAESTVKPTRFYQGRAGVTDAQNPPRVDIGQNPEIFSGTITPDEFGRITIPDPAITAEAGASVGRPANVKRQLDQIDALEKFKNAVRGERRINDSSLPAGVVKDRRAPMTTETRMAELRKKFGGQKSTPESRDATELPQNSEGTPYERSTPYTEVSRQIREKIKRENIPTEPDVVARAAESPIPEVKKAAVQVVEEAKKKQSFLSKAADKTGIGFIQDLATMGSLEKIKRMGPEGQEIWRKVSKARLDGEALGGEWSARLKADIEPLNKDQYQQFYRAADFGEPVFDPAVQKAVDTYQKVVGENGEIVKQAMDSKMSLRGKGNEKVPFQAHKGPYWARKYPTEFFKNPEQAIKSLIDTGMSPEDAKNTLKNAYRFGERLISPQHGRQADVPGYRTDMNAMLAHVHDMGRRIAEAKEFGPMDTADAESPLGSLIGKTSDPTFTTKVLERYLGRDEPPNPKETKFTKTILKAEAALHLSQFAISNANNLATIPMRANSVEFGKALVKAFTKSGKRSAEESGALQTIHQEALREAGGESLISKAYMMHKSEGFNRAVASIAGQGTAKHIFDTLKTGKGDKFDKARLEDLLLEKSDDVLKQGELSDAQIRRAGGRMAEITQGRAHSIDLPEMWSRHPSMDMVFLFKKYAFRQSKIIKDALTKGSPAQIAKNTAIAAAILQATGEATGDVKAGIKGAVNQNTAADEIRNRGTGFTKFHAAHPVVDRMISNYMQAWALGLLGDATYAAASGRFGGLLLGPVGQDITDVVQGVATGNKSALEKKAARSVPIIGSGLADRVPDNRKKSFLPKLARSGFPRLPSP